MLIRPLAPSDSFAELTALLHAAYADLGRMGFNYSAVDQDEAETRARAGRGDCLVAVDAEGIAGTVTVYAPGRSAGCGWYERPDVAVFGQFGVRPGLQGQGLGMRLLRAVEARAAACGAAELALDTSEGAARLVGWYGREGYRVVETVRWAGKSYRSLIMSKGMGASG